MLSFSVDIDGHKARVMANDEADAIRAARVELKIPNHQHVSSQSATPAQLDEVLEVAAPLIVRGERLIEAGEQLRLDDDGGATVVPEGEPEPETGNAAAE